MESWYKHISVLLFCAVFALTVTTISLAAGHSGADSQGIENTVNVRDEIAQLERIYSDIVARDLEIRTLAEDLLTDGSKANRRQRRNANGVIIGGPACFTDTCDNRRTTLIPGLRGKPGYRGSTGPPGERGSKGDNGNNGLKGYRGESGQSGEPGDIGEPGLNGMNGVNGNAGSNGSPGQKGYRGSKGHEGEGTPSTTPSTAVYTRWGSNECHTTADLVYEGYAAGASYNQKGGGANYVCLPRNPHYRIYENGVNTWRAYMYGAEYEVVDFPPFYGKDNGDVPCAVCSASGRSVTIMQPARIDCPSGWTREYYGYLMAQAYIYYRSEWTCVDHSATLTSPSSTSNSDGALFYPTEVCCGNHDTGLPCADYPNGHELSCSVCSR